MMMRRKNWIGKGSLAAMLFLAAAFGTGSMNAEAAGNLDMSTEYPGVTAKAGENVSFNLDFDNLSEEGCDADLSIESLPEGWDGYFIGDSSEISKVHINKEGADNSGLATFKLTVPDDVQEGTYNVKLKADAGNGDSDVLELEVKVQEEQNGQSDFSSEYPELEGSSGTSFSFDTTLVNNRKEEQSYSLSATIPDGWQVSFTPSGESSAVASATVGAGSSLSITVAVTPPETIEEGEYTIPCAAVSASENLTMDLKVKITGSYEVQLSTPSGNLNCDAYANAAKNVTLSVTNNGNVELTDLSLTSSAPSGWEVEFDEDTIESLAAGETKEVTAKITPDSSAMTGDYMTTITVKNAETESQAEFRVSVKTRTGWGIAAIAVILVLIGILGCIFKKYGRR